MISVIDIWISVVIILIKIIEKYSTAMCLHLSTFHHTLHFHSLEDVIFVQFNWYSGPIYSTDVQTEKLIIGYNGGLRYLMVLHVLYFLLEDFRSNVAYRVEEIKYKSYFVNLHPDNLHLPSPSSSRSSCADPSEG